MKILHRIAFFFVVLLGFAPQLVMAQPWVISASGSEVTDQKTGLIWRRCAEGMTWSGTTCTGAALPYTHVSALQLATTQATATGVAWRLPNIKELASLSEKSKSNPAIDATAFPATPSNWFWSSTPDAAGGSLLSNAWSVRFSDGGVRKFNRNSSIYLGFNCNVRLVRGGL